MFCLLVFICRAMPGSVLDDYSRYILSWKLYTNMRAQDVIKYRWASL